MWYDWAAHCTQAITVEAKRRAEPIAVLSAAANEWAAFWRRRKSRATAAPQQQRQQREDWCVHRLWFSSQTSWAHIHRSLSLQFSWLDYSTDRTSPFSPTNVSKHSVTFQFACYFVSLHRVLHQWTLLSIVGSLHNQFTIVIARRHCRVSLLCDISLKLFNSVEIESGQTLGGVA